MASRLKNFLLGSIPDDDAERALRWADIQPLAKGDRLDMGRRPKPVDPLAEAKRLAKDKIRRELRGRMPDRTGTKRTVASVKRNIAMGEKARILSEKVLAMKMRARRRTLAQGN